MDPRGVIDTIIQSSVVALFHASGVAVAPVHRSKVVSVDPPVHDLTGLAKFDGRGMNGTLLLSFPTEVFPLVKQDGRAALEPRDLVRELTNQLMGRIKNRLMQFQVTLQATIPVVMERELMLKRRAASRPLAVYLFRTLRGEIVVALEGAIDEAGLVYSGAVNVANEGDIILF